MEVISEAEISMLLDTFMYLDYREAREGTSLKNVIKDLENHEDYGGGGIHYGEYQILSKAVQNEQVGELTIHCQSGNMGYDSGTAACCFVSPDGEKVYVVYRGTGDGEWPDNGLGMTQSATIQQERALSYFEAAAERLELSAEQRVVITGHSKGGNKAQFVAMETKRQALVDVCYSVDGQGFSQKAISRWKQEYGSQEYEKRRGRIWGICGENDYVNVLGHSIIRQEQIRYIKTPVEKSNFAGYHDIKYMFAQISYDDQGKTVTSFLGTKNPEVKKRGELGNYAAALSQGVMELKPEDLDGCAGVLMHLMECMSGSKEGINGEKLTLGDLRDFAFCGIPVIAESLFQEKGKELLTALVSKGRLGEVIAPDFLLEVSLQELRGLGQELEAEWKLFEQQNEKIRAYAEKIPGYLKGGTAIYHQVKLSCIETGRLTGRLRKTACVRQELACLYEKWNNQKEVPFLVEH